MNFFYILIYNTIITPTTLIPVPTTPTTTITVDNFYDQGPPNHTLQLRRSKAGRTFPTVRHPT